MLQILSFVDKILIKIAPNIFEPARKLVLEKNDNFS